MKAFFCGTKKLNCKVQPAVGSYALDSDSSKDVYWDHCREQFAAKFNDKTPGFYFCHLASKSQDIANFLTKFETIIGNVELSTYCHTNKKTVIWISPNKLWTGCSINRSLMTIVVRCGLNYDSEKDNFDDALFGNYKENTYLKETRSATLRFLFGFTKFSGIINPVHSSSTVVKHGWREEFKSLDDISVRRRLSLPEGEKKESCIVGMESLWT